MLFCCRIVSLSRVMYERTNKPTQGVRAERYEEAFSYQPATTISQISRKNRKPIRKKRTPVRMYYLVSGIQFISTVFSHVQSLPHDEILPSCLAHASRGSPRYRMSGSSQDARRLQQLVAFCQAAACWWVFPSLHSLHSPFKLLRKIVYLDRPLPAPSCSSCCQDRQRC